MLPTSTIDNYDRVPFEDLIEALKFADDAYFNTGEPIVEDQKYDIAKRYAYNRNPAHVYFTGIGSEVRGSKVTLPYPMGSLDQIDCGKINDWITTNALNEQVLVVTEKLDGISALLIFDHLGELQIAYSRGNGIEGADITRHVRKIPSLPRWTDGAFVVRAELIISKKNFKEACKIQKSRSGDEYKNPRNMIAGIMNAKENDSRVYQYVSVVAYEIVNNDMSKLEQLSILERNEFSIPNMRNLKGSNIDDDLLSSFIDQRRQEGDFEIDGVVVDVNHPAKRKELNPTKSTLNPAYAVKYKTMGAENIKEVRVVGIDYNISKHGYVKPVIRIEPTDLMGVTVQKCTGFNMKFIVDNKIGEGAIIKITRSGDVIPFCLETVCPAPNWSYDNAINPLNELNDWAWTESGVDAVMINPDENDEVRFKQIVDFFESVDVPVLREGNIRKMWDAGFRTIVAMIQAEEIDYIVALGKRGAEAHEGLHKRLSSITHHDLLGSLPFFGRGVGKKKFKKLFEVLDKNKIHEYSVEEIATVEGFDTKTAEKIVGGVSDYLNFMSEVQEYVTFVEPKLTGISMKGQNVVMTGFRDKAMAEEIEANGGRVQSGVSKTTTIVVAANPNSNSGKAKKARDLGIQVIGIDEFKELL